LSKTATSRRSTRQVCVIPAVAHDGFAHTHGNWRSKNRAVENEGMEFAVLAARIDTGRQITQQRFVVCTAGESRTDAIFHAGKISLVTKRDDAARKFGGLAFPD